MEPKTTKLDPFTYKVRYSWYLLYLRIYSRFPTRVDGYVDLLSSTVVFVMCDVTLGDLWS